MSSTCVVITSLSMWSALMWRRHRQLGVPLPGRGSANRGRGPVDIASRAALWRWLLARWSGGRVHGLVFIARVGFVNQVDLGTSCAPLRLYAPDGGRPGPRWR